MKIIFQALLLIMAASFLALLISVLSSERQEDGVLKKSENQKVEIILTGDVMLGRSVMTKSIEESDTSYPFRKVGEVLRDANLVIINLENPIISNCPASSEGYIFCTSPELVEGLVFAGVDIVNLANNHSKNYGESGLQETINTLKENNVDSVGVGELLVKELGGKRFGFLGFDFTTRVPEEKDYDFIDYAASQTDILITSVHWGLEYTQNPTNSQKQWAKEMINSGVDVVVGHGPHWVQDVEYIQESPVYFSLGNFIFDQMWSEETKKGLAVKLIFEGDKLIKEERLPIYMSSWAQPEFVAE